MKRPQYEPRFSYGDRVRFAETDQYPQSGQSCRIIEVLPNPSARQEHQWYDVRFDDYTVRRFLGKYLSPTRTADTADAA